MDVFKNYLKQELVRRIDKNQSYSLRAFARHLGLNHATLSSLLSGKRKITAATISKISKRLGLGPDETRSFLQSTESTPYYVLQSDNFSLMSEWYFDAILELTHIENFKFNPKSISQALGISAIQARVALETLERLELLKKTKKDRYELLHENTTNILDPDFTSAAHRKYQRAILEKSIEALETVERSKRDHSSLTMAISSEDLPKAKELIKKTRHELNKLMQRKNAKADEIYQLQVSFFPVSQISNKGSK